MLGATNPVFDTGENPTPPGLSIWQKLSNWWTYGNSYPNPTVSAPPAPPVSVWTTAPSNEQQATQIVDYVISQNAQQNAQNFQNLMNQVDANVNGTPISWGLIAIVGITLIGVSFVKMR